MHTGFGDVGEAFPQDPAPKRQKISGDVRDLYRVTMVREVNMKKFKTKGQEYTVRFNEDLDIHGFSTVVETLKYFKV